MPLLNYTTKIPTSQTIGEMQAMLVKGGAQSVSVEYTDGLAVALSFTVPTAYGLRAFLLPVPDLAKIAKLILAAVPRQQQRPWMREPVQAERVAWRILKDWLEAQLAIIEIEAASLDQVMLPYMTDDSGRTVYELYVDRQLALPAASGA